MRLFETLRDAHQTSDFRNRFAWCSVVCAALFGSLSLLGWAQQYTRTDREIAEGMLQNVSADVQKYYYDDRLNGIDWQARVQEAKKRIDAAQSLNSAMSEIATLLNTLNDSHTFLSPPPRTHVHDYGFQMEMIGDRCYVVRVRSGSDAEKKGLKPGDEILAVNENLVSRNNFSRMVYIFNVLRPQPALRLRLADGVNRQRQLEVTAHFQLSTVPQYFLAQGFNQRNRDGNDAYRLLKARYFEKGDALLVVKIRAFFSPNPTRTASLAR